MANSESHTVETSERHNPVIVDISGGRDFAHAKKMQIDDLYKSFVECEVTRAFVVPQLGMNKASNPALLEPITEFITHSPSYKEHEGIFIGRDEDINALFFVFVHNTQRGLAQGGVRFCDYESLADLISDGLRLSHGMTHKNALADLWWGGGKGIIAPCDERTQPESLKDRSERRQLFQAYGRFVASLGGVYYTAEDMNTTTEDMDAILSSNRFTTCVSPSSGGSGNPSSHTALGVFNSMKAAWKHKEGTDSLQDVQIVVQGVGNVGYALVELLEKAGAQLWIADTSPEAVKKATDKWSSIRVVESDEVYDIKADILSPCAVGATINESTIQRLKVSVVCGAANNILESPEDDADRLEKKNILYIPDYFCNRMGIVNCADEWCGYLEEDVRDMASKLYENTMEILNIAQKNKINTWKACEQRADEKLKESHPMEKLQGRGQRLIKNLTASGWASEE